MRKLLVMMLSLLAAIFAASLPQAATATGHNSQATLGSNGSEVVIAECPAGEVLIGFVGRSGAAIDRLQILCAPILADGNLGATHPYRDSYGGFGGAPMAANACNPASRIAGVHVALVPDNRMVAALIVTCVDRAGNPSKIKFGGFTNSNGVTFDHTGELLSGTRYGATADYRCPDESFTGIRVRFDTSVRGVGLLCDRVTPIVAQAAPAPVIKQVHRTGKARTTPLPARTASGPGTAPRVSIGGSWRMLTEGGNHSNLELYPQGQGFDPFGHDIMPIPIGGKVTDADGRDDVVGLSGTLPPDRMAVFNYARKNGTSGTCQLAYSADGQSLGGVCVEKGSGSFKWSGTRGSWPLATPARPDRAALRAVSVKRDVDVFPAAGGQGQSIGNLAEGTTGVTLVEACRGDWCHVRWPGHEGWVYDGPGYNSLDK